jgi:hypothetical protein
MSDAWSVLRELGEWTKELRKQATEASRQSEAAMRAAGVAHQRETEAVIAARELLASLMNGAGVSKAKPLGDAVLAAKRLLPPAESN